MPFTPFHFGLGGAAHIIAPRYVSFLSFCFANVLIDIEPLYYIVSNNPPLHRFFHTYIGATLIVILTIIVILLLLKLSEKMYLPNFFHWKELKASQIILGAALGSYSHIVLDSITHSDIRPFAPLSQANNLFRIVSLVELHEFCLLAGFFAIMVITVQAIFKDRRAG